jgi:septal ring factor EnvC (AmiA/AmiB activator)
MQQDLKGKKIEIIIEGLENKIKDYEASLEKKDFIFQATEGSLAEIQAENARLSEELLQSQTALKEKTKNFEQEKKDLQAKYEAEAAEIFERPSGYVLEFWQSLRATVERGLQLGWGQL